MSLEEFYTPVCRYFGDGCNMEIIWAKHVLFIIRYIFVDVLSDESIIIVETPL